MYFSKAKILAALAAAATASTANARTFAVNHFYGDGALMEGRVDPIVNPGVASTHVHTIQGGNAFNMTMTDDQALKSTCTSSRVKNDKSNYWTPKLYFQDPTTKMLEPVKMFYMNVYYFFDATTTDEIKAFPEGLRIFTGNSALRTPPATGGKQIIDHSGGAIQPVQWTCPRSNKDGPLYPTDSDGLHGVGIQDPNNEGSGVGFPDKNCDGYASPLRADIHLPACYNPAKGVANYKENMDYPTHGNCPAGWIHVPHMFYEVYWNTPEFQDRWTPGKGSQPFVLANGDPTGYSLHADFLNGWDTATLQQIIDNCDAGHAGMDKCPGLMGGVNDPSGSCNIDSPIPESITGIMDKLPGGISVGAWGENVAAAVAPAPAGTPAVSTAPESTAEPAVSLPPTAEPVSAPKPTTKPAATPVPASSTVEQPAPSQVPVSTLPASSASEPATMVTSYVTSSRVLWTTVTTEVTAKGPAPTSASPVAPGWSYVGCYADTEDRVLTGIEFANIGQHAVSNTKCAAYCESKGFTVAGTEWGGQCFCSNSLNGATKVDESNCSKACEGDSKQICGGSMTLSIYSKGAVNKARNARHMHRHVHPIHS
ncbi:uncharacterized protein L3040_007893 [Drepanopeziza brunnea f. sp. 'multigermtubi']|uniref:uncharacterized protein n=1 Tax=Drepanopeziza brunnea f. sp. 'multigermtubi' TaxID=698441 RepID=UPI00238DFB45|nr:hypothetical protein L3040_007893 [Drepanopeziza brunnea f. sp. 'multigermtubi']